jgi:hypothetical protein
MPYPTEHAARVRDPGDFLSDSIRRKTLTSGVDLVAGKLAADGKNGPMVAQAYRFDADAFSAEQARAWCRSHGIRPLLFEEATPAAQASARAAFVARLAASAPGPNGSYRTTLQASDDGLAELRFVAAAPNPDDVDDLDDEGDDDGLIRRRFRLFSADVDVCDSYGLWTCTPGAVLAEGSACWAGTVDARGIKAAVPVILGHDRATIPCGRVESPAYVESDGFLPAGVEGTLAIDPQINPAAARAVDVGLIRAVSSCVDFEWRPSHPDLELQAFCEQLGDVVDDRRVVLEMTRVCGVPEVSLVLYGAEPYSTTLTASAPIPAPLSPAPIVEAAVAPASSPSPAAGLPPAPDRKEATMPLSEIRAALGLPDTSEPAAVSAAVQAVLDHRSTIQAENTRLTAELATLRAAAAQAEIVAELDKAQKVEGRFSAADRAKFEQIGAKGIDVLRAVLSVLPEHTIPVGVIQAAGRAPAEQPAAIPDPPGADPKLRATIQKAYKG